MCPAFTLRERSDYVGKLAITSPRVHKVLPVHWSGAVWEGGNKFESVLKTLSLIRNWQNLVYDTAKELDLTNVFTK